MCNILNYLMIFLLTVLLILIIIKNAKKFKLIDMPNERSVHNTPKPRGAGIAIFLSFIISTMIFQYDFFIKNLIFFIAIIMVFIVGIFDDIKGTSPKTKFIVIILATTLLFFMTDLKILSLGEWFGYKIDLPIYIALPFTIFAVSGYTNALNLIDGLDGLAATISIVIFLSFLYLGLKFNDTFIINISLSISIALLAFLLFNWYPSKIFMGDSGSLVLGFLISIVAIRVINYINVASILFLAALPIVDTILVMVRRIQRGISPFTADKNHLHHKMLRFKIKIDYTVLLLILIQITFSLLGILLENQKNIINLTVYLIILYIFFHLFDDRKIPRKNQKVRFHTKVTNILLATKNCIFFLFLIISLITLCKYLF